MVQPVRQDGFGEPEMGGQGHLVTGCLQPQSQTEVGSHIAPGPHRDNQYAHGTEYVDAAAFLGVAASTRTPGNAPDSPTRAVESGRGAP
ncbi:hypothetical protein GCM10010377_44690 [Streptomyces viridiviolaceus]|nr:hypothetical protein GCM10010377_44690 [Streptomyces viridiviolaceus]